MRREQKIRVEYSTVEYSREEKSGESSDMVRV